MKKISLKPLVMFLLTSLMIFCNNNHDKTIINLDNVQKILTQEVANFKYGGVVAVAKTGNGNVETGASGFAPNNVKLTTSMSLGIGSNTKTYTAVLIYKLIEQKKLGLTSKLGELLPTFVNKNLPVGVTIEQLLKHSSGIYDPINDGGLVDKVIENPSKVYSFSEYIDELASPEFENGDNYQYSNTNYFILGKIIEEVSGKPYHVFLREQIIAPLKLEGTFLSGKEESNNEVADGFGPEGVDLSDFPREGVESVAWSSGSIFSTVKDVLAFYEALFKGSLLQKESLDHMLTSFPGKYELKYGGGIFQDSYKGNTVYFHSGEIIGYTSCFIFNKDTGYIVAVISNQMDYDIQPIAFKIMDGL